MVADRFELRILKPDVGSFGACDLRKKQLLRLLDSQGSQNHSVEQTKHSGIQSDTERKRENGDCGEAGTSAQLAQAVSRILNKVLHAGRSFISQRNYRIDSAGAIGRNQ